MPEDGLAVAATTGFSEIGTYRKGLRKPGSGLPDSSVGKNVQESLLDYPRTIFPRQWENTPQLSASEVLVRGLSGDVQQLRDIVDWSWLIREVGSDLEVRQGRV